LSHQRTGGGGAVGTRGGITRLGKVAENLANRTKNALGVRSITEIPKEREKDGLVKSCVRKMKQG